MSLIKENQMTKTFKICKVHGPLNETQIYPSNGRCNICYEEWRQKNSGKLKKYYKEYFQNNKEVLNRRHQEWIENNKEHRKSYLKEYYVKNKARIDERNAAQKAQRAKELK
jgi:hypothetical protein